MKLTAALEKEIKMDIERCKQYTERNGSMKLYQNLVAKYIVIDPEFEKGLSSTIGKAVAVGQEFDYRPELNSTADKLKMWLILYGEQAQNKDQIKIRELLERGEIIGKEEYHPAKGGFPFSYVGGPKYDEWMAEINILNERYLKQHPSYDSIKTAYKQRDNNPSSFEAAMAQLKVVAADDEFWKERVKDNRGARKNVNVKSNKVFIVHGHDETAKQSVARFLEKCGFEAIILHEQPDGGRTIIEKIDEYTDVVFAVVLYTSCDVGRAKEEKRGKPRARQNVVFEHGYLIGKLSRERVCALVKDSVEIPGDMTGVVYKQMDAAGAWKTAILREMQSVGIPVDASKLL